MKYAFPILTQDGKEFADSKALNGLLKGESGGHYLLGGHSKWHGGIHISEQTAPWCKDKHPVRCIADGKVVAFRMMPDYLSSTFQGQKLKFSNCFCLVQHAYCETNPDTKEKNEFTFYSLYMHLLPWDHYQKRDKLVLKTGRNVRNSVPHLHPTPEQAASDKLLPALTLPAGTEFERVAGVPLKRGSLGKTDYDFVLVKVLSSGKQSDGVLATQGCEVWLAMEEAAVTTIMPKLPKWLYDQVEAELTQAMAGRADPVPGETGQLPKAGAHSISLPAGTRITFDAHRLEFQLIGGQPRKMARCTFEMPVQEGLAGQCGQAWVCVEDTFIKVLNQSASNLGKLYPLPSPVPIAAGDTIGYLGLVETPTSLVERDAKKSIHQVHLEVFSQDTRLAEVLANKAQTKGGASYAKVPAGLPLARKDNASFTPTETLSQEVLLDSPKQAKDNADIDWIEVTTGLFVQQSKVDMLSQHDWLKIGFQQVDGSGSDGHLAPEAPSPFFLKLAKTIDPKREGELTSADVHKILQDKAKAETIRKLIVKHPSEWYETSTSPSYQWLEKMMAEVGLPEFNKLVEHEKQRIDSLEWMQSAKELKLGPDLWHFSPLSIIQKSENKAEIITLEMLLAANLQKNEGHCREILLYMNKYAYAYGLDDRKAIAHFLSQIGHESQFLAVDEDLNYSAPRMRQIFGCIKGPKEYNKLQDDCNLGRLREKLWTEESTYARNAKSLGSYVYANRNGNGSEASGDGYKYRGRGLIQITGKVQYELFTKTHNEKVPSDIKNFLENPDDVATNLSYAVESAFFYWFTKQNLHAKAKTGNVMDITRIVNGGDNGYADRALRYSKVSEVMGIS
ncbi:MAG: hypothetical protein WBF70_17940 [Aeromonas molluscorum]